MNGTAKRVTQGSPGTTELTQRSESPTGISVIIPTYNERENIEPIISACLRALSAPRFDAEVVVVDDDSEDYTWQYPERLFGHDPRVRVIRRQASDAGLARSVIDGFGAATHEFCAVIDADFQHPPEKLAELVTALAEGADIAIGSRHVAGGGIENWPASRKLVSRGATVCARLALSDARAVSDPLSGFFAVRRTVVEDVTFDPQGYKILLEILARGEYESVVEVPYVFRERERGESKLTASEYLNFLEHLGQLTVSSRGLDRVIEPNRAVRAAEFALVGAVGTLVNMAVFAALTLVGDLFYFFAGVVAFVAAVNWNFAGNWLLTFDRPREDVPGQYVRFHLVSLTGFVVYSATLAVGVQAGLPLLPTNAMAIALGAIVNFLGSDTAVFPTEIPEETSTDPTRLSASVDGQTNAPHGGTE